MRLRLWLGVFAALTLPFNSEAAPSLAQSSELRLAQQVNCASPDSTMAMSICADREYQVADRKLNQTYQALKSKLSGQQQQRLTTAQQAWLKFRDANCAYARGEFEGGTAAGPVGISCLAQTTEQRTKDLSGYLQDLKDR